MALEARRELRGCMDREMGGKDEMRAGTAKLGTCLAAVALLTTPAWAQAQQPSGPAVTKAVALVSDACPAVQPGGRLALDWNPNFDPAGEVSGLHSFELIFRKLDEYGVNVLEQGPMFAASTAHTRGAIAPLGNGFYHIELTIPRRVHAGAFRLVAARATADVYPEYKNSPPWPLMTDSPVHTRLCVTVLPPAASRPTTPGN